jgi:beta-glucosidase
MDQDLFMTKTIMPSVFLWGAATAGHQTEGDNTASDTWFLEHLMPTIFREPSGMACNSFQLWETDLDLVAGLGLNASRFSIEWARVEPVEGEFSSEALDHYEAIVDGCLARGLAPVVTFNHFTAPHWFAVRGAWLAPEGHELFARYCDAVMERFGDRISVAVTLNEPNLSELLSWLDLPPIVAELTRATLREAERVTGSTHYVTSNVADAADFEALKDGLTRAHIAGRDAIKARRPELPVGISIAMIDDVALPGGEEIVARKRAELYDHWLRLAANDDFIGVQNYERMHYGPEGSLPPGPDAVLNQGGSEVEPDSLRAAVEYAHEISGRPVFVTEHGVGTDDDDIRAWLIPRALDGLRQAIADGVPVVGYTHWSLLDNFEWIFGFGPRFGLVEVDRDTFVRAPKPSAAVFSNYIAASELSR